MIEKKDVQFLSGLTQVVLQYKMSKNPTGVQNNWILLEMLRNSIIVCTIANALVKMASNCHMWYGYDM